MSATLTQPTTTGTNFGDLFLHLYKTSPAKPGDIALCGHMKREIQFAASDDKCVVCLEIFKTPRLNARREAGKWHITRSW